MSHLLEKNKVQTSDRFIRTSFLLNYRFKINLLRNRIPNIHDLKPTVHGTERKQTEKHRLPHPTWPPRLTPVARRERSQLQGLNNTSVVHSSNAFVLPTANAANTTATLTANYFQREIYPPGMCSCWKLHRKEKEMMMMMDGDGDDD